MRSEHHVVSVYDTKQLETLGLHTRAVSIGSGSAEHTQAALTKSTLCKKLSASFIYVTGVTENLSALLPE